MKRFIGLSLILLVFWLLLSGMFTPFLVAAGIGCSLAVAALIRRMATLDNETLPIRLAVPALVSYWPWLIKEIIKSGWDVSRRIISPGLPISPTMATFAPSQVTDLGLVVHANSITLTPGTIAVEVEPGRFLVHALSAEGAAGLAGSEMDRRCRLLEDA